MVDIIMMYYLAWLVSVGMLYDKPLIGVNIVHSTRT